MRWYEKKGYSIVGKVLHFAHLNIIANKFPSILIFLFLNLINFKISLVVTCPEIAQFTLMKDNEIILLFINLFKLFLNIFKFLNHTTNPFTITFLKNQYTLTHSFVRPSLA